MNDTSAISTKTTVSHYLTLEPWTRVKKWCITNRFCSGGTKKKQLYT